MSVKIVHCADIHIGSGGDPRRDAEVKQTFSRIVDYAKEIAADLLLIAGDLFDGHKVTGGVLEEISAKFAEFSGRVFIAPGNHDYYGANTFWDKWELPENVTVFRKSAEVFELADSGVRVFGGAFEEGYRTSHILREFPKADENLINIAVVHGDIGTDSLYGPIDTADMADCGMDYIALGHIHKRSEIQREGSTCYAYCGCPEGQGFDELGAKGVYAGTVDKGAVKLDFVPLCHRQFIEETVDISSGLRTIDIAEIILRKISEKYGDEGAEWFYKIILTGETSLEINPREVAAAIGERLYFAKVRDKTKAPVGDMGVIAAENSLKGLFVRKMLERMESLPPDKAEEALKIGLAAFSGEVKFYED